jgi:hypothetical protein
MSTIIFTSAQESQDLNKIANKSSFSTFGKELNKARGQQFSLSREIYASQEK